MEPSVNPNLVGAVVVPDGSIDPFRLTASNMMDAAENGAKVFTYCEVKNLIREGGKVIGVDVYDHKTRLNVNFCTSGGECQWDLGARDCGIR
ncbi:anaerobic glycerol-3-phosphate dehydrogenase subunit A [Rodentibacter pneumotropicus]|uniref:Anaerobic glycerol-3-phosphate dehydrogenase subunit A n=1 Tax=Rodentibacter pneumotropicus TaxID=758 RepID=A0A3S4TX76_9PAST|nr:anaerobic glycerol-3-phosphate dehydrogenase subunit A [Rodentibacter pneumotropicus]